MLLKIQWNGLSLAHHRGHGAAARLRCVTRKPTTGLKAVAAGPAQPSALDAEPSISSSQAGNASGSKSPASAFLELGVDPMLADALPEIDVTRPSPIQAAALPAVLSGANCAIQSYTGSGKTLSYLLPTLTLALRRAQQMAADPGTPRRGGVPDVPVQVLVVAPSQELAMQIVRVAKSLMPPDLRRFAVQQVIGGANPKRQAEALAMVPGPLVVVGTPGRLSEMVRTGTLRLHRCPIMVLDEADQLLASAFAEDINHLSEHCGKRADLADPAAPVGAAAAAPRTAAAVSAAAASEAACRRQTVLVSATLTPSVLNRSARWCPDPRFVSAGAVPSLAPPELGPDAEKDGENPAWGWGVRGWDGPASAFAPRTHGSAGGVEGDELIPTMPPQLQHYYMVVEQRHKVDALRRTIHALGIQRALVFMNFQQRLQDAQFKLQARGMKAAALHGELPRLARGNILNDFRRGRLRALVVSDVAARGLDVPQCDAVFHLELPSSAAHYAHRAGRTGRLSAALAAQAAAEAAAAAAAAAAADGEQDAGGAQQQQQRAAAAAAAEDLLVQAAGTVVTVVNPSERFVVDKLAAQLGVPLLEAHLSHGQLRLGPPPRGYSFEKDADSDKAPAESAAASSSSSADKTSRKERKATAAAASAAGEATRRDAGPEASTSGRQTAASAPAGKDSKNAYDGTTSNQYDTNGKYEVIVDEDDDIIIDDDDDDNGDAEDFEVLDEDLEAFKRLRPAQIRQLGTLTPPAAAAAAGGIAAAGISLKGQRKQRVLPPGLEADGSREGAQAPKGAAGKGAKNVPHWQAARQSQGQGRGQGKGQGRPAASRSEVMRELQRELEELRAEKEARKQQQPQRKWDGRGRDSKGPGAAS